jgi:hypothetical protein
MSGKTTVLVACTVALALIVWRAAGALGALDEPGTR